MTADTSDRKNLVTYKLASNYSIPGITTDEYRVSHSLNLDKKNIGQAI